MLKPENCLLFVN